MDQSEIYARLTMVFEDVLDEDSIVLTPKLSAKDVDSWDSLAHVRLVLSVERAFKVKFSTSEIGRLANVGDLAAGRVLSHDVRKRYRRPDGSDVPVQVTASRVAALSSSHGPMWAIAAFILSSERVKGCTSSGCEP